MSCALQNWMHSMMKKTSRVCAKTAKGHKSCISAHMNTCAPATELLTVRTAASSFPMIWQSAVRAGKRAGSNFFNESAALVRKRADLKISRRSRPNSDIPGWNEQTCGAFRMGKFCFPPPLFYFYDYIKFKFYIIKGRGNSFHACPRGRRQLKITAELIAQILNDLLFKPRNIGLRDSE